MINIFSKISPEMQNNMRIQFNRVVQYVCHMALKSIHDKIGRFI